VNKKIKIQIITAFSYRSGALDQIRVEFYFESRRYAVELKRDKLKFGLETLRTLCTFKNLYEASAIVRLKALIIR
jgi:hypothetical protein